MIHKWAWGCGAVSGAVSLFATESPGKALVALIIAAGLTYIVGPCLLFLLGE